MDKKQELINELKLKNKFLIFSDIEEQKINFLKYPNYKEGISISFKDLGIDLKELFEKSEVNQIDFKKEEDKFFNEMLEINDAQEGMFLTDEENEFYKKMLESNDTDREKILKEKEQKNEVYEEMAIARSEKEKFSQVTKVSLLENDTHIIFTKLEIIEYYGEKEFEWDNFLIDKKEINYRLLLPQNRFRYLNWLLDVSKPIEKQYVLLYLECLERNMLIGNLKDVIDELVYLRKKQNNITFLNKSEKSLNLICHYLKRLDLLYELYLKNEIKYSNFILIYQIENQIELTTVDIYNLLRTLFFKLTKYKNKEDKFLEKISNYLIEKFGKNTFPINSNYKLVDAPIKEENISNYNLYYEIGFISFPEAYYIETFNSDLNLLYNSTY